MKKKVLIIIAAVLVLLLLIPFPIQMKDGGSVKYKAVLYSVTDVHRFVSPKEGTVEFEDGLIIEILGMEVFNNINE
ncbi:MAG: hypothetical protein IJB65_04505 [Clostridia bacterium]|nr:hypothetical protein [Clostridia bacterium]